MQLLVPEQLFELQASEKISKRSLYDLIQFSKQESSPSWDGVANRIGNTPQQGINWIGQPPAVKGVIIKTRPGSYAQDGWVDEAMDAYRYSFKARKGVINHAERANRVLIDQAIHLYPVFLFTEAGKDWRFEGRFVVREIAEEFVVLEREASAPYAAVDVGGIGWREGARRYVTHLLAERSRALVSLLKSTKSLACDVCDEDASARYGVPVVDAHHRTPLSTWTGEHEVKPEDIALVCPNCHRAIHAHMRSSDAAYDVVRQIIRDRLHGSD